MSVVDFLLNSLIKHLQRTQKARKKRKKAKRHLLRRPRKPVKRRSKAKKRRTPFRQKKLKRRLVKKVPRRFFGRKRSRPKKRKAKSFPGKKKVVARPKARPRVVKKIKKSAPSIPENKVLSQKVCVGEITHYFSRIQVVVLKMTKGSIKIGDEIHILGKGTDFIQKVESLQIESLDVKTAHHGQLVGLKVKKVVKVGSKVYK